MIKRISGLILLALGVLMILWGVWQSWQIFNAKKPVPEVFTIVEEQSQIRERPAGNLEERLGQEIQQVIGQQFSKVLSSDFIAKIFNLSSWALFMFILISAGGKLSTIGIRLLN